MVVAVVVLPACSSDDDSSGATDDASSPSIPESATQGADTPIRTGSNDSTPDGDDTAATSLPDEQQVQSDDPATPPTSSQALGVGTEPPGPTTTATPAYVAPPTTLAGRAAADIVAPPLSLTGVRVFPDPSSGAFALATNVTNAGNDFLNDLTFTATISDASGAELDQLQVAIPALAAGETTTIHADGGARYDEVWSAVDFSDVAWSA